MSVPRKLLIEGEDIAVSMRTHAKALLLPAVVLIVLAAIGGFLTAILGDSSAERWVVLAIWVAIALGMLVWSVAPFARWLTSEYTVTSKRVISTSGVFSRTGRAIPLHRVNDVTFEQGLLDRLLGCGTLVISDASEQAGMQLRDVPRIQEVHRRITDLVFGTQDGADDDGARTPGH
ncbi:MAG TPA: PH domain-containing protein [Nocardioidaceae bacterium]|jgi:uncharacterized membrane protein YdbT with pleckstrin-like domain|nr:PH domain-containing protein [Nocardioidaceae bacterium]